jgi:exopolyphosphatase / guanosine-5'-triphosphate,3'-diphosphate pyrophosphatase
MPEPEADSTARTRRIAAIDLGTNSFHSLIVDISPDGSYEMVDSLKEMVLLGHDGLGQRLTDAVVERGLDALRKIKQLADSYKVEVTLAYATSAIREAENGGEFIQRAIDEVGIKILAIPGTTEAELIALAVQHGLTLGEDPHLIMDIGGGSTEFIIANQRDVLYLDSKKLGVSRIHHEFVTSDPLKEKDIAELESFYVSKLGELADAVEQYPLETLVGTSGTLQNIASMMASLKGADTSVTLNEFVYTADEFRLFYRKFMKMGTRQRALLDGLDPKRVDLVVPGMVLLHTVINRFRIRRIRTCTMAMREGIILRYIRREYKELKYLVEFPDPRRRSIFELLRKCNWHEQHSSHVTLLALQLFDDLKGWHGLTPADRELLEYAALTHDIGYHISHHKHHKHALYIILNADLKGFTQDEIEIMAHVARYHRRSAPKKGHAQYAALQPEQQRRIKALAGLLRVADGLDRSHFQNVQDLKATVSGTELVVRIKTMVDPQLEIWGAMRKRELLEKMFARDLRIERVETFDEG